MWIIFKMSPNNAEFKKFRIWGIISILLVTLSKVSGQDQGQSQNDRSYDEDWVPITSPPCPNCHENQQQSKIQASERILIPATANNKQYIPDVQYSPKSIQQNSDAYQQYLREAIQENTQKLNSSNIAETSDSKKVEDTNQQQPPEPQYIRYTQQRIVQQPQQQPIRLESPAAQLRQSSQNQQEYSQQYTYDKSGPQQILRFYEDGPKQLLQQQIEDISPSSTPKYKESKESVQLVYVPYEMLSQKVSREKELIKPQVAQKQKPVLQQYKQAEAHYVSEIKQHRLENIKNDFIHQALEAQKLQEQLLKGQIPIVYDPTTSQPKPRRRKPHQPPLAVYLTTIHKAEVSDVLNELKNADTIAIQDSVGPDSPKVFVGPSTLDAPDRYTKFELPYLSHIESNRIQRKINSLPFFVAPLSYKTPPGYSKIPLPSPHVGSVVVATHDSDTDIITASPKDQHNINNIHPSEQTPRVNPTTPSNARVTDKQDDEQYIEGSIQNQATNQQPVSVRNEQVTYDYYPSQPHLSKYSAERFLPQYQISTQQIQPNSLIPENIGSKYQIPLYQSQQVQANKFTAEDAQPQYHVHQLTDPNQLKPENIEPENQPALHRIKQSQPNRFNVEHYDDQQLIIQHVTPNRYSAEITEQQYQLPSQQFKTQPTEPKKSRQESTRKTSNKTPTQYNSQEVSSREVAEVSHSSVGSPKPNLYYTTPADNFVSTANSAEEQNEPFIYENQQVSGVDNQHYTAPSRTRVHSSSEEQKILRGRTQSQTPAAQYTTPQTQYFSPTRSAYLEQTVPPTQKVKQRKFKLTTERPLTTTKRSAEDTKYTVLEEFVINTEPSVKGANRSPYQTDQEQNYYSQTTSQHASYSSKEHPQSNLYYQPNEAQLPQVQQSGENIVSYNPQSPYATEVKYSDVTQQPQLEYSPVNQKSTENYYLSEQLPPINPILPGLINNLQDQSVRHLLNPGLLNPSTEQKQPEYKTNEPATTTSTTVYEVPRATATHPPTTATSQTTAVNKRSRSRFRVTTPRTTDETRTAPPRRTAHRGRRPVSRTRSETIKTTEEPVTTQAFSAERLSNRYATTETSRSRLTHSPRQRTRTRVTRPQNTESYTQLQPTASISTSENTIQVSQQANPPPQSYMQFERPTEAIEITTVLPEITQSYRRVSVETENPRKYSAATQSDFEKVSKIATAINDQQHLIDVQIVHPVGDSKEHLRYEEIAKEIPKRHYETTTTRPPSPRGRVRGRVRKTTTTTVRPATERTTLFTTTRTTTTEKSPEKKAAEEDFFGFIRAPNFSKVPVVKLNLPSTTTTPAPIEQEYVYMVNKPTTQSLNAQYTPDIYTNDGVLYYSPVNTAGAQNIGHVATHYNADVERNGLLSLNNQDYATLTHLQRTKELPQYNAQTQEYVPPTTEPIKYFYESNQEEIKSRARTRVHTLNNTPSYASPLPLLDLNQYNLQDNFAATTEPVQYLYERNKDQVIRKTKTRVQNSNQDFVRSTPTPNTVNHYDRQNSIVRTTEPLQRNYERISVVTQPVTRTRTRVHNANQDYVLPTSREVTNRHSTQQNAVRTTEPTSRAYADGVPEVTKQLQRTRTRVENTKQSYVPVTSNQYNSQKHAGYTTESVQYEYDRAQEVTQDLPKARTRVQNTNQDYIPPTSKETGYAYNAQENIAYTNQPNPYTRNGVQEVTQQLPRAYDRTQNFETSTSRGTTSKYNPPENVVFTTEPAQHAYKIVQDVTRPHTPISNTREYASSASLPLLRDVTQYNAQENIAVTTVPPQYAYEVNPGVTKPKPGIRVNIPQVTYALLTNEPSYGATDRVSVIDSETYRAVPYNTIHLDQAQHETTQVNRYMENPTKNDEQKIQPKTSTQSNNVRSRGRVHFQLPENLKKQQEISGEADVEGGNYPANFPKNTEIPTPMPSFQITVEPEEHQLKEDDQQPHSSIRRITVIKPSSKNEEFPDIDVKPVDNNVQDVETKQDPSSTEPMSVTEIATEKTETVTENKLSEITQTTLKPDVEPTSATTPKAGRRRGIWRLIRKPSDNLEVAESQNYPASMLNNIFSESVNKISENIRKTIKPTLESMKPNDGSSEKSGEPNLFNALYEMFGISNTKEEDVLKVDTTTNYYNPEDFAATATENAKVLEATTETSVENVTDSAFSTTLTAQLLESSKQETTTEVPTTLSFEVTTEKLKLLPSMEKIGPYEVEPWQMKAIKTSTSTEVSHQTEICFRGRCIKSLSDKR